MLAGGPMLHPLNKKACGAEVQLHAINMYIRGQTWHA